MAILRHQAHKPVDAEGLQRALSLVDTLARMVPLWEMDCTKEPDAAMVSYSAMLQED